MKVVNLLYHQKCYCFRPFIDNFQYILEKHGYIVYIYTNYDENTRLLDDSDVNDNIVWFVILGELLLLPKKCIVYNMDLLAAHVRQYLTILFTNSIRYNNVRLLGIYDFNYGDNPIKLQELCDTMNIYTKVMTLPYGYSSFHKNIKLEKTIDILFYGNISDRRHAIITSIKKLAEKYNYVFVTRICDLFNEEEKENIINKSKIILSFSSFHFQETQTWQCNDLPRISQIISSENFCITEYRGDSVIEDQMSNYVPHFSTIDELLKMIKYYLDNPHERLALISLANKQYKKDINLESNVIDIIKDIL